jgi:hypothetical protein
MGNDPDLKLKLVTVMSIYELLDNGGPGGPGEATRVMTRMYIYFKSPSDSSNSVIRDILNNRGDIYRGMGEDILYPELVDKIVEKSNGELPFAIFVDMVATNKATNNMHAVTENFDVIVSVILDNYNRLVPERERIYDVTSFKSRLISFMRSELM